MSPLPPQQPISQRHTRPSVAVVEPTTRVHKKDSDKPRVLPLSLTEAIEKAPEFRVVTRDGSAWVNPITGSAVPLAGNSVQQVAKGACRAHLPQWREKGSLSLPEVLERRWRIDVLSLLKSEKRRMTIFSRHNGQWLNPFSGNLEADVTRDDGKITANTVKAMAIALSRCHFAERGELLSREDLRDLKIKHGYKDPNEEAETTRYIRE